MTSLKLAYSAEIWSLPHRLSELAASLDGDDLNQFVDHYLPRFGHCVRRMHEKTNLVTDVGARWLINHAFTAPAASLTWAVGLKGTGTPNNADTMSVHATWTEVTDYTQTTRPALVIPAPTSGRSGTNSASKATIIANAAVSVYGFFVCTSNVKGGTAGTLYSVVDYASAQALTSGQVLRTTVNVSF